MSRKFPQKIKRLVVKVGSSLIATYKMRPQESHLPSLVEQICKLNSRGVEVVLVSSGAIILGMAELAEQRRPNGLASLQARAAIGQGVLMGTYSSLFMASHADSKKCAQVLLTWDDFDDRQRYLNARNTLNAILEQKAVPIINENDTISTDEIKFGDNDKLAALVACLVQADVLIILSDVEGLYDLTQGEKKIFEEIKEITGEIEGFASGTTKKHISRGGMIAKLEAIKIATHANIPCIIAHGEMDNVLIRILEGERIGTFFVEKEEKLLAHKHWISFGAKPKGKIIIDDGAKKAILEGGKSLLLPGIVSWDGHFKAQDVVVVHDHSDQEIARGVINYSISDLHSTKDKKGKKEVIHRDELVLSKR